MPPNPLLYNIGLTKEIHLTVYLPTFTDQRIIDFCTDAGEPPTVQGFRNALSIATGVTEGSMDDLWVRYLVDVKGFTFVGLHSGHYASPESDFAFTVPLPYDKKILASGTPAHVFLGPISPATWIGAVDTTKWTLAMQIKLHTYPPASLTNLFGGSGLFGVTCIFLVQITTLGELQIVGIDSGFGVYFIYKSPVLTLGQEYTLHLYGDTAFGATGEVRGFIDGVAITPKAYFFTGFPLDFASAPCVQWNMFADNRIDADIGFITFNDTTDATATHFYAAGPVDQGDDGTLAGAPVPLVFHGCRQEAHKRDVDGTKGWNDLFNQGDGGAWTSVVRDVTDA